MTRQIWGKSRRVATAAVLAAVAPLCATVPAATAAPAAVTAPTAATKSTAASRQYVAVVRQGSLRHLRLVDRASGKVVRTLATKRATESDSRVFHDADLATDGSVYAVVGNALIRYSGGRSKAIARYVDSVEASPDGKQLAVTITSPDGDGDGKGLEALRILTPTGKVVRTLNSYAFPVDSQGRPEYEVGGFDVQGWLNASTLVVRSGCCASSNTHLVRADVPRSRNAWIDYWGQDDAKALGVKGSSALVARPRWTEPDSAGMSRPAGVEVAWLSSRYPTGKVVQVVKGERVTVDEIADRMVKKYGATPLFVSPKRFPYRSTGTVVTAHV